MTQAKKIMNRISSYGLVPLVTLDDAQDAVPLARALGEGGLPVAEVTFRTAAAAEAMSRIHAELPDIILGAGTVHTVEQAREAVDCGAVFIVTPSFNPAVIEWCLAAGVAVLPGSATPRDFEDALALGLDTLKFFPASVYGGVDALRAAAGPFAGLRFVPTGGVSTENMADYLALPNVAAVGGSFTCPSKLVKARDWAGITQLIKNLIADLLAFEIGHIGVNSDTAADTEDSSRALAGLLGMATRNTSSSTFVGEIFEVMQPGGRGRHGHIALSTPQIERAVFYLGERGCAFDESTARRDGRGRLRFIYLRDEIAGFAIHLSAR